MVALSLYRGNLHRVSDVPRRWLPPKRQISLKDFKVLLSRRSRALSRLKSSSSSDPDPNPDPNPNPNIVHDPEEPTTQILDAEIVPEAPEELTLADCGEGPSGERDDEEDPKPDILPAIPMVESDSVADCKPELTERGSDRADKSEKPPVVVEAVKVEEFAYPDSVVVKKEELMDEKLKRKKEVEEKLKVLNDKKHGLVQLLKQVLNAEEELKRRSAMQGVSIRPPAPLQVDATNDSVSMTRHLTPRMGTEPNLLSPPDAEGGEGDALSNQNLHSRQIFRMNSMSPSSESPIRRLPYFQHNTGLHPTSRTTLGAAGSPSRFSPMGHPASVPTLSVSGTNYVASSPSPAASGGTSNFRDSRLPSPWN